MVTNQTAMIGPKAAPMRAVPSGCTANSPARMTTAHGSTYCSKLGAAMLRPSSAESTEIAGVIAPSP